jgi:hypothetical protein
LDKYNKDIPEKTRLFLIDAFGLRNATNAIGLEAAQSKNRISNKTAYNYLERAEKLMEIEFGERAVPLVKKQSTLTPFQEQYLEEEIKALLHSKIIFTEEQRKIIPFAFGFHDTKEHKYTNEETGKIFNQTRAQIENLKKKVRQVVRQSFSSAVTLLEIKQKAEELARERTELGSRYADSVITALKKESLEKVTILLNSLHNELYSMALDDMNNFGKISDEVAPLIVESNLLTEIAVYKGIPRLKFPRNFFLNGLALPNVKIPPEDRVKIKELGMEDFIRNLQKY